MKKLPFKIDPRFKLCDRDMFIAFGFQLIYMVFILAVSYGMGGKSMSEYQFILGMPSWFFICVVGVVVFIGILAWLCLKKFADMSVEAYVSDESEGGNK